MSESLKKIWLSTYMDWQDVEKQLASDDIAYIREDVVLELVEALEELMYARTDKAERMAEAALAKARGE